MVANDGFERKPGAGCRALDRSPRRPKFPCRSRDRHHATSFRRRSPSCRMARPQPWTKTKPLQLRQFSPPHASTPRFRHRRNASPFRKPRWQRRHRRRAPISIRLENVIDLTRKHKSSDATQAEAAITDPVARKLAEWIILRSDDNGASTERYRAFLAANPSWPSQTFLRRRVEASLWDDHRDDATVLAWFENERPLSAKGRFVLGAHACSRAATAPTPSIWFEKPGGPTPCRRRSRRRRWRYLARCWRRAIRRRGWIICFTAASRTPRCARRSVSGAPRSPSPGRGSRLTTNRPACAHCSKKYHASCTAILAMSSPTFNCCAARRSSRTPRG